MALSQPALAAALEGVLVQALPTVKEVAEALTGAYVDYAAEGAFGTSELEIPSGKMEAFAAALETALEPAAGSPVTFGSAWAAAVGALWVGVPVVGAQAGATVGCPGAPALAAAISAVVSHPANTSATAASGIAAALHAATQTVTANVAPPPGTTLPIA